MTSLDQREYYEYLEARHKKARIFSLISLIIIAIFFSNEFRGLNFYKTNNEIRMILFISLFFTVHIIRTWNGSDELKFLRELFR